MKANTKLKTRIKRYLRENPGASVSAYDIQNKFVRDMPLAQAQDFLHILEVKDKKITKCKIEDVHGTGVDYIYQYNTDIQSKHKKRRD